MRSPDVVLRETGWPGLETAYGPATDLPRRLAHLLGDDPEAAAEAVGFLDGALLHQQSIVTATAPAAEFVAGILGDPRVSVRCTSALVADDKPRPLRADLLEWLALVAEGVGFALDRDRDHNGERGGAREGERGGDHVRERDGDSASDHGFGEATEACLRLLPDLYAAVAPFVADPDPATRRGAVRALAHLLAAPALAPHRAEAAGHLLAAAPAAPPDVRADTADAIARWGLAPRALLADDHPGVRGHAAMAPALDGDPAALAEVRAALRDPIGADHWFGPPLPWGDPAKTTLVAVLLRRTSSFAEVVEEAVAVARVTDAYGARHELAALLDRAGAGPRDDDRRRLLEAVAENDRLWSAGGTPVAGLVAAGIALRRDDLRRLVRAYD